MDLQTYKQRLLEVKKQLDNKEIDEIPLDARPKMLDFDFDKDSYVIVSYSRKDFVEVYLLLAYLYNEGYRFWYDNGMKGTEKWLEEYKNKFENPNCLGTITFFGDNYISNSTKEELEIIYNENGYVKKNVMVSLISLKDLEPDKILKTAIFTDRISIENAATIKPVLAEIISEEKEKTIHRYMSESDIRLLTEKIGNDFDIRILQEEDTTQSSDFVIEDGVLLRYAGNSKNVVIPDGVRRVEQYAFANCTSLTSITIPNSITNIRSGAFSCCTSLTSITLPDSVKSIANYAFSGCTSLTSITIPGSVTSIASYTFSGCTSLTSITIPGSVTSIASYAFSGCTSLSSITLPDSVTSIGDYTFFNCTSLTGITIPSSVTRIKMDVFCGCTSLTSITIPGSVTSIGSYAFYDCTSLTNITIPDSVTRIEYRSFHRCFSLKEITFEGTKKQWEHIENKGDLHCGIKYVKCADGTIEL